MEPPGAAAVDVTSGASSFRSYVGSGLVYSCVNCRAHVALHDELVSKAFQGRHGRALLFSHVINVDRGPREHRMLTTGLHTVCDTFCVACRQQIGWFYAEAYEPSQKYKEGKYIVEKACVSTERVELSG